MHFRRKDAITANMGAMVVMVHPSGATGLLFWLGNNFMSRFRLLF